jgi:hypothetical protein
LAVDRSLKAKTAESPEQWYKQPNRYDLPGVDAPEDKAKGLNTSKANNKSEGNKMQTQTPKSFGESPPDMKVPDWYFKLPEKEIKSFYSRGRFTGFRDSALDVTPRQDGSVDIDYADPIWDKKSSKNTLYCTFKVRLGFHNEIPINEKTVQTIKEAKVIRYRGKEVSINYLRKFLKID